MASKKILRIGVQKTPIQKIYEMSVGSDTINVGFLDNFIGCKYLWYLIKAKNTQQSTTVTMPS